MAVKKVTKEIKAKNTDKWVTAGWVLLLLAGLGHMMPTQLGPVLNWAVYGVSLQMVIGVGSVIAALYYLLEE